MARSSLKVRVVVLVLSAVVGTIGAARGGYEGLASPTAPTDPAIDRAARSVREGKIDEALAMVREAAKTHPEWPSARLIVARLLFATKQTSPARQMLEKAATESPDDPGVYLTFATLSLAEGRLSDARLNCERALSLVDGGKQGGEPARIVRREAHAGLATVAEGRQDWESARSQLLAWLADDPKNGSARQRLGRALFRLGKTDDAFRELKQASADDPKLDPAAALMGVLYGQQGNVQKATEWFDYARKAEPGSVAVRLAQALAARTGPGRRRRADRRGGRGSRPEVKGRQAAARAGRLAPPRLRRRRTGLRGPARRRPGRPHHRRPAGPGADRAGRPGEAVARPATGRAGREAGTQSADALATLGWAHVRLGQLDQAEQYLRAAVSGGQASPDTAFFLARLQADRGRRDEALNLLKSVTALPGAFAYRGDAETPGDAPGWRQGRAEPTLMPIEGGKVEWSRAVASRAQQNGRSAWRMAAAVG